MNTIQQAVNQVINIFTENIAKKYNLDKEELIDIWNQIDSKQESSQSLTLIKPITSPPPPSIQNTNTDVQKPTGCPYLFTKGAREGELCNCKPIKGETYCSKHKKYEGLEPKVKKVLPTAKKSMAETLKPSQKQPVGKKPVNIVLKKHKILDKYMDTETGFLFRSKDDRVVVGRAIDDKCVPLNDKDIDEIKSRGFKYEMIVEKSLHTEEEEKEKEKEKEKVIKKCSPQTNRSIKGSDAKSIKKSISSVINNTSEQIESVEDILGMLQKKTPSGIQKKSTQNEEFTSEAEDDVEDDASIGGESIGNYLDEEED